ncbi:OLC1v1019417C2 [Oldenlandia corymbosa var. corymbosa]|uniref:OLC1v1019417C2 n=1 Tax=Oldenlandia corymbosa var. corymbosa TaxID=529605 RepID=A0AAV1EE34_OLDCO|nr:OLC1v1019417C2 [Oldenlandia corymbosa var. corymbosa]
MSLLLNFAGHIVIISVVLLILLFLFQYYGTSKVSFIFSPIMLLWLLTNSAIGIFNICKHYPSMLKAISPHYIVLIVSRDSKVAWTILGAVFLGITGAEAMFADLGHFNKKAIQWSYSFLVYPSLIIAYAGETAYLIKYPENIANAYYSSLPSCVYWPMFAISTLAAIVASQSMISATFSIMKQSQELDCFPRVSVIHTSSKYQGQVYCPEINYGLMILCVGLVIGFQGGTALANAYGVVCIWVMIITTMLTTLVMLVVWNYNILLVLAFFVPYILIEGIFMTSLLNKIPQGGWVPFAISTLLVTIILSWRYGRNKQIKYETECAISPLELNQMISSPQICRTPGICFFLTDIAYGILPVVGHYIQNARCVREIVVFLTIKTLPIDTVLPDERYNVEKLGDERIYFCLIKLGYMDFLNLEEETHKIITILAESRDSFGNMIEQKRFDSFEAEYGTVFVMGRMALRAKRGNGWLDRFAIDYVYKFLEKNCSSNLTRVRIPPEKTLQVGIVGGGFRVLTIGIDLQHWRSPEGGSFGTYSEKADLLAIAVYGVYFLIGKFGNAAGNCFSTDVVCLEVETEDSVYTRFPGTFSQPIESKVGSCQYGERDGATCVGSGRLQEIEMVVGNKDITSFHIVWRFSTGTRKSYSILH